MSLSGKILLQAIGNPSRGDDALGPMLLERLEKFIETKALTSVELEWVYQLQIEQAEQWSRYDVVLCIDAHAKLDQTLLFFELSQVHDDARELLQSHGMSPQAIFSANRKLFSVWPKVYVLALQAQSFELGAPLSQMAQRVLDSADDFLRSWLARELTSEDCSLNPLPFSF